MKYSFIYSILYLYLILSCHTIPILTQVIKQFDIIANFTLNEKDENGVVDVYNTNTFQLYFNGPVGGIEIDQLVKTATNEHLLLKTLTRPPRYPIRIKDSPYAVADGSLYVTQDVGSSSVVSGESTTPPAHLQSTGIPLIPIDADSTSSSSSNGTSFSLFSLDETANINDHQYDGGHFSTMSIDGMKKSKYSVVDAHILSSTSGDSSTTITTLAENRGHLRNLKQSVLGKWEQEVISPVVDEIIVELLTRIDTAKGNTDLMTKWRLTDFTAKITALKTCVSSVDGKKYFSFGVPCPNVAVQTVVHDQYIMTCLSAQYGKWLENLSEFGQNCFAWPLNVLPNPTLWCDYQGTPNPPLTKWAARSIAIMNRQSNRHMRIPLGLSSPTCEMLKTTYDGDNTKLIEVETTLVDGAPDPTANLFCTFDLHDDTKSVFNPPLFPNNPFFPQPAQSDARSFNIANEKGVRTYYDSPDCPCMPTSNADTNFYYTCPTNPYTMDIPRALNANGQMKPEGLNYQVGVQQKCKPIDRNNPASNKGFCVPLLVDQNMYDYSAQVCEDVEPSWPEDCPGTAAIYIALCISLIGCLFAKPYRHCSSVSVCRGQFTAERANAVAKTTALIASQVEGATALAVDVSKMTTYIQSQQDVVIDASSALSTMSQTALNTATALNRMQQIQNSNLALNSKSIEALAQNSKDISAEQDYNLAQFNAAANDSRTLLINLQATEPVFINQTLLQLATIDNVVVPNVNKLMLINKKSDLSYASVHNVVEVMNSNVVQVDLFRNFKNMVDETLSGVMNVHGKIPLVSDYNLTSGLFGQARITTLPASVQNMTIESYWMYALEWLHGSTTNPLNPSYLTTSVIRVHQHHLVQSCDTLSMTTYSKVSVEIDQWRDTLVPGNCWMSIVHSSCESSLPLGSTIQALISSTGRSGEYPLFTLIDNSFVNNYCVSGTYQLHNNTVADYSYQLDNHLSNAIISLGNSTVVLPNTALWPGFLIVRSGKLGGLWPSSTHLNYPFADSFNRRMAETTNAFNSFGAFPMISTLYGLFSTSYSIALGSASLITLYQATQIGRLPRYGILQKYFKIQNPTAPIVSPTLDQQRLDSQETDKNNTLAAQINSMDVIIDIINNPQYIQKLVESLQEAALVGFDNVLSFSLAAVNENAVPFHIIDIDDSVEPQITMLLSKNASTSTTSSISALDIEQMNENLIVNSNFATVGAILDENKLINAFPESLNWIGYISCLLSTAGCVVPASSKFDVTQMEIDESGNEIPGTNLPLMTHYVFDLDNLDSSPYSRTLRQGEGFVDYGKKRLGGLLSEALNNGTYIAQLALPYFRNLSSEAIHALPEWGRSVLYYLNATAQMPANILKSEVDIEQILHEAAFNEGVPINTLNVDLMQYLVDYDPYWYSISLSSYLTTVQVTRIIPAAPFDDYQLWDCTCLKPLVDRKTICRLLDLFYPAVPVSWLSSEPNPDFWDHFYLQPKSATIEIGYKLPNAIAERIVKATSPCPDPASINVQPQLTSSPFMSFTRPNYGQNVTLIVTLGMTSTKDYSVTDGGAVVTNATLAAEAYKADCSAFVTSFNPLTKQYDASTATWTVVQSYSFASTVDRRDLGKIINIPFPSSPCQVISVSIQRKLNETSSTSCYSYSTSLVRQDVIDKTTSTISSIENQLQSRNVINVFASATSLLQVTEQLSSIANSLVGQVRFADVSSFASSNPALEEYLRTHQDTTHVPIGLITLSNSNNNITDTFQLIASNPSDVTPVLVQTNFSSIYNATWSSLNNTDTLQNITLHITNLINKIFVNSSQSPSSIQDDTMKQLVELNSFIQQAKIYNDSSWDEVERVFLQETGKYNQSAAVIKALAEQPVFQNLKSEGVACLSSWSKLNAEYPDAAATVTANIHKLYDAVQLQSAADQVTSNPFSILNGNSNKGLIWSIIWIVLLLAVIFFIIVLGRNGYGCFCARHLGSKVWPKEKKKTYRKLHDDEEQHPHHHQAHHPHHPHHPTNKKVTDSHEPAIELHTKKKKKHNAPNLLEESNII